MPYIQDPTAVGVQAFQQSFGQGFNMSRAAAQDKQQELMNSQRMSMMEQQLELLTMQNAQAQKELGKQALINLGEVGYTSNDPTALNELAKQIPSLGDKFGGGLFQPVDYKNMAESQTLAIGEAMRGGGAQLGYDKPEDYMVLQKGTDVVAIPRDVVYAPYLQYKRGAEADLTIKEAQAAKASRQGELEMAEHPIKLEQAKLTPAQKAKEAGKASGEALVAKVKAMDIDSLDDTQLQLLGIKTDASKGIIAERKSQLADMLASGIKIDESDAQEYIKTGKFPTLKDSDLAQDKSNIKSMIADATNKLGKRGDGALKKSAANSIKETFLQVSDYFGGELSQGDKDFLATRADFDAEIGLLGRKIAKMMNSGALTDKDAGVVDEALKTTMTASTSQRIAALKRIYSVLFPEGEELSVPSALDTGSVPSRPSAHPTAVTTTKSGIF